MRVPLASALAGLLLLVSMSGCSSGVTTTPTPGPPSPPPPSAAALQRGVVVSAPDGVTAEVEVDGRVFVVRYLGLVAPNDAEAARAARDFNRFLVEGKEVILERDQWEADPEGRLLRYVYVQGEMVNKSLLVNGYVSVDTTLPFRHLQDFLVIQEEARLARRGLWGADSGGPASRTPSPATPASTPTPVGHPGRAVGTLPSIPGRPAGLVCDYSGSATPVIKGNVDTRTGEKIYHVPGSFYYNTTVVDESRGDRWFCTEAEAEAAGFRRAAH